MPKPRKHNYNDKFFDYVERGARRSAQHIIPLLCRHLRVSSVVDIGCGRRVWVDEWRQSRVNNAVGVDGNYINANRLAIPNETFTTFDVSEPFRLGRGFDPVQSLEVAEHIPSSK